ncbi:right-handed parallel beta-helix repeat-containing protein (plasmid) [Rhizobium sullae]|uniref:Right-handed parallel beta-helix repeat-containing protein n=2 Tax=Rhizobium sullae TaxID=50338 RepID=A0ABY5XRZ2_RHISU|nr:right-handed parallel beta-helix repeat-containing protein [Rhizobium sullae]UWU16996.1 right-handed parallel beta-helix repeat-containing protein [Rhizobium sullae]
MRTSLTLIATLVVKGLVGLTALATLLSVLPTGMSLRAVRAQELTVGEQSPQLDQLAPTEREITEDSLKYGAQLALTRWRALRDDEKSRSFDAYFEIFREVARIESLDHATQIAGVDVHGRLAVVAAELNNQMNAQGLSARDAGVSALKTLIASSDRSLSTTDPDSFKVRYTLILDYMSGIEVANLSLDLAKRLAQSKLNELALDIYVDFLPLYFNGLTSAADRQELMKLASANAGAVADPAVFRVLTDLLRMSPRAEKVELAQLVFDQIDVDVIRHARDSAGSGNLILSAWVDAVEVAHSVKAGDDIATLREQARLSLDTRAFELLILAEKDEAARNRLVSDAVMADIREKRPLVGYDRVVNLALPPAVAIDSYLALIHSFSGAGYDNYVKALVELVASATKSKQLQLTDGQAVALFRDIEILRDPAFIRALGQDITGDAKISQITALRADVRAVFSLPVDQPVGAEIIATGPAATKALQVAASLINGEVPDAAVLAKIDSSNAGDIALLSQAAARLWQYSSRRELLTEFVRGRADVDLRQAVALGVTGFAGFRGTEGRGADFVAAIGDLLPSTSGEGHTLLAASIGQGTELPKLRGEALSRYARYLAASGQSVAPLAAVADADKVAVEEADAIFSNIDVATTRLKTVSDYKARVGKFRRLAEARAGVLDDKGWLNSATAPAKSEPDTLDVGGASTISDGRIVLYSPKENSLPTAGRPFMPNLLLGRESVTSRIPVPPLREANEALADISKRGETRATRLIRFSSEHFDEIINLGVREYLYLNSESTVPRIIFVTRGVLTMSELIAQVRATDPDAISLDGNEVTLNVPLAVNDGASLVVSGQEIKSLKLNTKAGAFIVNSGKIYFDGVTVSSVDVTTDQPSYVYDHEEGIFFRPFILSWSGSETLAADSHFVALGYAGGRTYGMSLSSGSTDAVARKVQAPAPTGYFINNSFENLYYGFYAFEAKDIVFVGNELVNGVIYGLDPHDRSKNLMMAYNTAYGTQKKHGIIISREVDDSFILGNLSFENHGSGIMLDRQSYGTIVYANDASRNEGDGFAAMESPCALVDSNMFYGNGRSGVKVRNSWDVHVEGNQIRQNKAAGIEAYIDNLEVAEQSEFRDFVEDPYYPIATMVARDNILENNRVGLMTRGASEAMFYRNKFIDQLPRYVSGDLKPLGLDVVTRNMKTGVLVRSVCVPRIPVKKQCALTQNGIIIAQSLQPEFRADGASTNYCINTVGSPQSAAFNAQQGE